MMQYNTWRFEELRCNYSLESVRNYLHYAARDLALIRDYITAGEAQVKLIEQTPFHKVVCLNRSQYGRVEYDVRLELRPIGITHPKVYFPTLDVKTFPGTKRHEAIACAKALVAEHQAEFETNAKVQLS